MNWIKQLLTGKDGETHDIARHSWLWSMLTVLALAVWQALVKGVLDFVALGTAIAAIAGAHGGAIGFKAKTEPEPESDK